MVFARSEYDTHEQVDFVSDAPSGLQAIIAIHDTTCGPALGGCRMWPYPDADAALRDALRLSRGMTYKNALADLPLGGGKSVIIGDPRTQKPTALMAAMGDAVERLGGRYIVAEDVGTTVHDMEAISARTRHVAGIAESGGDPSPATAYGVLVGIRTAVERATGRQDLDGLRVAVQGLGNVGVHLCRLLACLGARLVVSDVRPEVVEMAADEMAAEPVPPDRILDTDVDVFAPCALGGVLDDASIPRLRARIVAGSANNQLAEARHGRLLMQHGILYAPDYVINAGGVINVAYGRDGQYDREGAYTHISRIQDTLSEVFALADRAGIPTSDAADRMAERRLRRL